MARPLTAALAALLLTFARPLPARAQSSASFPPAPDGQPAPPPSAAPAPPSPAPPPAGAPEPGAPPAPPPVAGEPSSWLDQRGPDVPPGAQPLAGPAATELRPPLLPYRDGLPVPPGYRVVHRTASGLLAGGLTLLAASYSVGLLMASAEDFDNGTSWLAVPVVGPWAAIGARSFGCSSISSQTNQCVDDAFNEVETIVFMAVDGLVQAAGAGLLIAGATSGHQELVRQDIKVGVAPPLPGRRNAGLAVSGSF